MSNNNQWLWEQLRDKTSVKLDQSYSPLITLRHNLREYRIYAPTPDEYIVSIELVQKVIELGGNTISFPTTWCRASSEAQAYGRKHGVEIVPHGKLLSKFDGPLSL